MTECFEEKDDELVLKAILNGECTPTRKRPGRNNKIALPKNLSTMSTNSARTTLTRRKRKRDISFRNNDKGFPVDEIHAILEEYKFKNHSLRLSASQIAAVTGFNPYSCLPKILLDLVYQGSIGVILLNRDARLLHLELSSEEDSLKHIAEKAGPLLIKSLKESFEVSKGRKEITNIQDARDKKENLVSNVRNCQVLSKGERKKLEEGIQHNINTGIEN